MKTRVLVLICDGTPDSWGYSHVADKVEFPDEVPVLYNYDRTLVENPLGRAKLVWEGDSIYAEIETNDGLQIVPGLLKKLTPGIGGVRFASVSETGETVYRDKITSVGLCSSENLDPRIKSIEEQEANKRPPPGPPDPPPAPGHKMG